MGILSRRRSRSSGRQCKAAARELGRAAVGLLCTLSFEGAASLCTLCTLRYYLLLALALRRILATSKGAGLIDASVDASVDFLDCAAVCERFRRSDAAVVLVQGRREVL